MWKTPSQLAHNVHVCSSPNGQGLVHWPKYGEKEDYLAIDAKEQHVFWGLKKDKFVVLTQTLPENVKKQKDAGHTEF